MKTLKTFWFILLLSLFFSTGLYAQNEANIWYFNKYCGLDFNTGIPVVLSDGQNYDGWAVTTISDSLGNFLYSSDWHNIYGRNGIIDNGSGIARADWSGAMLIKWPGKDSLYYLFTAADPVFSQNGFYYSVIDMRANNGLGSVTEKNIEVESCWDVNGKVAAVRKNNSDNIWVIVRKNEPPAFASFLVDENGFNLNPVISPMQVGVPYPDWKDDSGRIQVSPDKKFLIAGHIWPIGLEICSFNASTGSAEYLYSLLGPLPGYYAPGIEFSPDSKYLYVSYHDSDTGYCSIYQYDVQFISDSVLFRNSAIYIGHGNARHLQLARDGKIYCSPAWGELYLSDQHYVSVIHNPWISGTGCNFENKAIYLTNIFHDNTFPHFLIDYLFRFEWAGEQCQGYPIQFKPNFIPTPQTIQWNFDDGPGSTSWQLSPTYTFKNPGVHEIKVDVWYPSGRYEHTSREIEISPSPQPDLGPDTLICQGASITLYANCEADFFSWSTSQFGVSSITVSDSGTYWVKGRFSETGCEGFDTIHIGFHTPTIIDETNLVIIPTTCNGASGSITGLSAIGSPPYAFQWLDLSGNPFGTNIDATGLPAGQYYLTITDGNGCETESPVYTIEDAGNLQVTQVQTSRPHCFRNDGQIIISAFSPSGSLLEYSIDNGNSYSSDSIFTNLLAGSYIVHIRDTNGCEGFYADNPVFLADIPGPLVQSSVITDETDFLGNGLVEITATGSTPQIFYSINNGSTWQTNNGTFNNLSAGIYTCIVKDENDCDTTFAFEIQNIILTYLHAITGEGGHCLGNTAMIPVNVDNFNSVADFHLKLEYNADNLQCEGFTNVQTQLSDSLTGWVDQAAGIINLAWNSSSPLTFIQSETVAELVFTTKNPGQGQLSWYTGTTESYFTNSSGNPIPAEFQTGEVKIYEPPDIILDQSKTVCTGQFASIMSIAVGNQPPIDYQWIYPDGDTTSNDPFFFSISPADAGLFTLLATDRVGCTDQKSIELIVSDVPVAAFHGTDTLEMHTDDVLDAGAGLSSYRWNTGDSTQSININAEGMYTVEMESPVGCLGSDSVYVKLTTEEIPEFNLYVPNAFTPDGDGVNDTFLALYNGNDISHFTMEVYDRWGGRIFRSENILVGWDGKKNGKECPGGVYVYKIVFSVDGVAGSQERVGTVALVR
ncbi:MAG TPA: gliding motility-associated C-terminal domain-containing protein [Bacteroidales bacterium]|nr:gliding motility-associated C-terminal domain-containing protein [Bacteroidales bacterium]